MVCGLAQVTSIDADRSAAPVALFYNVANGFHNAPNFVLSDHTVRRRDNITGFQSGVRVAAEVGSLSLISCASRQY